MLSVPVSEIFHNIINDPQYMAANELIASMERYGYTIAIGSGEPIVLSLPGITPDTRVKQYYAERVQGMAHEVKLCVAMNILLGHASVMLQSRKAISELSRENAITFGAA